LKGVDVPVVVAVNKVDRLDRPRTVLALQAASDLVGDDAEIFPVSARTGRGVGPLVEHLASLLPEGPFYFPPEEFSDQPEHVVLAELVREQVLHRTRQEVPHAVEVQVDEIHEQHELVIVHAFLWVETESQKGILIGAHGRMIKAIGMAARRELERELGKRVHLDLSVRVRRSWRGDESLLDRLGIT
jgi:GTP-binding protein Era